MLGQGRGLPRLGIESFQLRHAVAQQSFVGLRLGQALARRLAGLQAVLPGFPQGPGSRGLAVQAAVGIQKATMSRRVEQPPLLELTLNLDEAVTQGAKQTGAGRLVVHEGAAAPVGIEGAAQEQQIVAPVQAVFAEPVAGRMVARHFEGRGHRGLGRARAHQAGVRTLPQSQAEGVQQDRLSGPGFAGQDAQSVFKHQVQAVDQNDVPNRQTVQHSGLRKCCSRCAKSSFPPSLPATRLTPVKRA